ncbi:MAG: hypothetical protein M1837_007480 [Sclerophora amabilis]|nr:MAG: hypothetical protein M1837_007480 [Sclerophora amabilis]
MFGVVCAGRPVQTSLTPLSPTQVTLSIPAQPRFSHLVVFLLPDAVLPPDTGAAVYIQLPPSISLRSAAPSNPGPANDPMGTPAPPAAPSEFRFLGALSAEKQSAIFRINNPGGVGASSSSSTIPSSSTNNDDDDVMVDDAPNTAAAAGAAVPASAGGVGASAGAGANDDIITLGISIEPATSIASQLATLRSTPSSTAAAPGGATTTPSTTSSAPWGEISLPKPPSPPSFLISSQHQQPLARKPPPTKILAQRIIKNAFTFLASFVSNNNNNTNAPAGTAGTAAGTGGAATAASAAAAAHGGEEVVPLRAFRDWWVKFEKKVDLDPGFLEREDDEDG